MASGPSRRLRRTRTCAAPYRCMRVCALRSFFFACGVFLGVIRWEDPACHAPWLTPSYLYYRVARVLLERNKISREDGNFHTSEAVLSAVPSREGLRAGGHPLTLLIRARRRYALRSLLVRVRRPSRRLGLSLEILLLRRIDDYLSNGSCQ